MPRLRLAACALAPLLGATGLPLPAAAEMIYAHDNAVESVTAGWFCRLPPDAAGEGTAGPVNLYRTPFPFVATGDQVPSQPGIGIGIVAQLTPFLKDEPVEARESHDGRESRWKMRVRPDGLVWLGYLHDDASDFPPGLWTFSLWRGPDEVFRYEINVLPRQDGAGEDCGTPVG